MYILERYEPVGRISCLSVHSKNDYLEERCSSFLRNSVESSSWRRKEYLIWCYSFALATVDCVSILYRKIGISSTRKIEAPIAPDTLVLVHKERCHRIPQEGNLKSYFHENLNLLKFYRKLRSLASAANDKY
jgi:hypothetical protein